MPHVFVSYAREDKGWRAELVRRMWEWGIPAWSDTELERGGEFPIQLERRIQDAGAFVLLMSPDSSDSGWVRRELHIALDCDVAVYPLLLRGTPFEDVASRFHFDELSADQELPERWFRQLARSTRTAVDLATPIRERGGRTALARTPEHLFGRATDVRLLHERLVDARIRTIVVSGFLGIGKTSAVATALRSTGSFFDQTDAVNAESVASAAEVTDLLDVLSSGAIDAGAAQRAVVVVDGLPTDVLREISWADLERWQAGLPAQTKLVVTSRGLPSDGPSDHSHCQQTMGGIDGQRATGLLRAEGLAAPSTAIVQATALGNPRQLLAGAAYLRGGRSEDADQVADAIASEIGGETDDELRRLRAVERASLEQVALSCEPLRHGALIGLMTRCGFGESATVQALELMRRVGWLQDRAEALSLRPAIEVATRQATLGALGQDVVSRRFDLIGRRRLLAAMSSDAVQRRQRCANLAPLVSALRGAGRSVRTALEEVLAQHQTGPFAIGNLLNLVSEAGESLEDVDLSGRLVSDVDLRAVALRRASLRDGQLERVRLRTHMEGLISVVVDEGGSVVVAGAADGRLHVFSLADGEIVTTVAAHGDVVTDMSFDQAGSILATVSDDGMARIWDARDWSLLRTFTATRGLTTVAVDAGGDRVLAGGFDREVWLWDRHSGAVHWHARFNAQVTKVVFGPEGAGVAVGCRSGVVEVWDPVSDRRVARTKELGGPISDAAFLEDDTLVISSADGRATVRWEIGVQREDTHPPSALRTLGVILSPDATLAATSTDQSTIEVWDWATGERVFRSSPDDLRFQPIGLNSSRRLVVAGGDSQALRCWDIDSGDELWTVRGHSSWVKSVQPVLNDTAIACCSDDESIHVWDRSGGGQLKVIAGHDRHIRAIAADPRDDRRLYSASDDRTAALWDLVEGSREARFEPHDGSVWSVAASGTRVATGTLRGTVTLWSAASESLLSTVDAHEGAVRSISFDAAGRRLATGGDDGRVALWKLDGQHGGIEQIAVLDGHEAGVWCVAFGDDEHSKLLASASMDGTARLWHLGRRRAVGVLRGHDGPVWSVVHGPQGQLFYTGGGDHTIRMWRIPWLVRRGWSHRTLQPEQCFAVHSDWVRSLARTSEGHIISGSHDGTVRVWSPDLSAIQEFPVLRPYDQLDLTGVKGLTSAQLESLAELGALTS